MIAPRGQADRRLWTSGSHNQPMLIGRQRECGQIDAVLRAVRTGRSRTLLLEGEAGIGKTALIEYAVARAEGLCVLRAAGTELESELAFSALHQLLRPIVGLVEALAPPQARALRTALKLEDGTGVDRFGVYAATLELLATAAEAEPLLCVVDDCQWLDRASAEALSFVARRLDEDRIGLLLAQRENEAPQFAASGIEALELEGLDETSAAALLSRHGALADGVAAGLVAATRGNPLALLELPALLSADQRAGLEPLGDPLPVSAAVERAFLGRAASLPERTRRALVVVAVSDSGELEPVVRALGGIGLKPAALEPAEDAGLVRLGRSAIEFRHPLVRSAIYGAGAPGERRAAHAALADALGAEAGDRRAWHLAAAATGPDEHAAAELERVAEHARRRGGVAAAARTFQEAARLSPGRGDRARRTFQAAEDWLRHGDLDRADRLLDEALALAEDDRLRLEIMERRGYRAVQRGEAEAAFDRLAQAADAVEQADPRAAAIALTAAGSLPLARLDAPAMLRVGERTEALWGRDRAAERPKLLIRTARARILAGETEAGVADMVALGELCLTLPATGAAAECAESLVWVEEVPLARRLLEHEVAGAREAGDHLLVAFALNPLALLELRSGRLVSAYAAALEAAGTAEEIGQPLQLAYNLALLARVEAALGREDDCREHATRVFTLVDPEAQLDVQADARAALGQLALGLGRPEEAIDELERLRRILADGRVVEPGFAHPWAGDLIEAYVHAGRPADAERELAAFEGRARAAGRVGALALAARCRGLFASDADYDACFEEALALHARLDSPLERFRTELCYAERLRRSRRRTDARERLRHALEAFDQLGETPWATRARRELAAIGGRVRRREPAAADRLTPQELQVALAVAEGASNREVASRLFLSPKTIEFHLGNVYRKLEIRSRRELIREFARRERGLEVSG
jgi:DNA-binding CsgD family transcriptional regulator